MRRPDGDGGVIILMVTMLVPKQIFLGDDSSHRRLGGFLWTMLFGITLFSILYSKICKQRMVTANAYDNAYDITIN